MPALSQVQIRSAKAEDASALLAFLTRLREESPPTHFRSNQPLPTLTQETQWITRLAQSPNSNLLIAIDDACIVGVLDFNGYDHPQLQHGGWLGITVDAPSRGQGIGRKLLERLIDWATAHPTLERLELEVFSNNPGAIRLYESVGFEKEGTRRQAIRIDGTHYNICRMGLLLPKKRSAYST